jgi:hypothetical protein
MKKVEHGYPTPIAGPFDGSAMSDSEKAIATSRLRHAELLVDLAFQGAIKIWSIASLIGYGFNLMRHKVRVSEANAASTRFVS